MYWLIIRLFMQSINFLSERLVPLRANPAFKYRELMREKRFSRIDFITLMFFFSSQCFSATSPEKLTCSSDHSEMDSTKSRDASYVEKAIARFLDRASSSAV